MDKKYIIVVGTFKEGFKFLGPFISDDSYEYIQSGALEGEAFEVIELEQP